MTAAALEVWGDPIGHSRSPALHAAAYRVLGLDWTYDRRRVSADAFDDELDVARQRVRGLSLTYPLKDRAFEAAMDTDDDADVTGAVNTLLLTDAGPLGRNTDVGGLVDALSDAGFDGGPARIVGAGATARSALVALVRSGAGPIDIVARRPETARALAPVAERLGAVATFAAMDAELPAVAVTVAALPGSAVVAEEAADALAARGGTLVDVVYGHWPTALGAAWLRLGAPTHDGLGMLLHQAVRQVRLFVQGDVEAPLRDETAVVAAMREALVGD